MLSAISCVALYLIKRVREGDESDDELSSNEMLTRFRGLHDQGEITPTEYKRIKSLLGERLQRELDSEDAEGDG